MFKQAELNRGNIRSITGAMQSDYGGQSCVVPVPKRGLSNAITRSSSGEYDGGDRVIGFPNGFEVDGDLLFTVGWGDGFAVRRLNNDGTMTRLFYENNFLYRDTTSSYNHLVNVAIDKVNKKGVVMTYNVSGYTTFDYSGLMNGGTTFVKDPRPTHSNPQRFIDTDGSYVDRPGLYYTSGMVAAGEWIYAGDHNARHYKKYPRRNLRTGEQQMLTWDNNGKTGTANVDRNGYRYTLFYDEVNDRVFFCSYYNANFMMVEAASTANPKLVWCDVGDAGHGDDGYEQGLHIEDPVNAPNLITIGGSGRHLKLDITPCQTGTRPTVIAVIYENDNNKKGQSFGNLFRLGTKYQGTTAGQPTDKMPGYPAYNPISPDRGRAMGHGWVDWDNSRLVSVYRYNARTEDTTSLGRGNTFMSDYGQPVFRMYSADGSEFWVQTGYGYNGHSFTIWGDQYKNHMFENWTVEYGTFTLAQNADIDFVHWSKSDYFVPSGCSLGAFVSNNNGATWEAYTGTGDTSHVFSSTGNQLRIKITGSGDVSKNAYRMGANPDTATYGTMASSQKDAAIKDKITKYIIEGKK